MYVKTATLRRRFEDKNTKKEKSQLGVVNKERSSAALLPKKHNFNPYRNHHRHFGLSL
jgi:hypothetical protein